MYKFARLKKKEKKMFKVKDESFDNIERALGGKQRWKYRNGLSFTENFPSATETPLEICLKCSRL